MRLLILLLSLFISLAAAGEKRAFTIADIYKIKYVSGPRISPDGEKVLFTMSAYDLPSAKRNTDIYMLDLKSGEQKRLTTYKGADFNPRWSPDGKSVLFISYRKGGGQAWRIPIDGGEAEQLTRFYTGVSSAEWMPDGKSIVFVSEVFPEAGSDSKLNRKLEKQLSDGPVQAHLAKSLLYRHWTSYRDWKYKHLFSFNIAKKEVRELTTGKVDAPAYSLGGREFTISPDGRYIAFSVKKVKDPAVSTNNDIWLLDLKENEIKNITEDNPAYDGDPLFSPDGRKLAFRMQKTPGYESDRFRLAVYDLDEEETKVYTEDLDNWVDDFQWSPEGKFIYFIVEEKGYYPLYRLDLKSGVYSRALRLTRNSGFQITPDASRLIVARSAIAEPVELWQYSVAITKIAIPPKRLTFFNRKLEEEVDIRPAEQVWIESPTGRKIHTFIIKPHDFDPDEKYPLVINVHGGPQMQWSDAFRGDWQTFPGAGYVLAFPNPHGSTGYGQEFTAGISKDWGGKVYRDVMAVTDYLAELPYVDKDNMGAMGWSWGGYFMMWLEGHKHPFKALASMMGVYDLPAMWGATEELWFPEWDLGGTPYNSELYDKLSPHKYMGSFSTPCLVITGEKDYRVPYTQSLEFFTALQRRGVDSRLIVFKNDGHWPDFLKSMPVYYNAHLEWFHRYLGGKKAPWKTEKMIRNQQEY